MIIGKVSQTISCEDGLIISSKQHRASPNSFMLEKRGELIELTIYHKDQIGNEVYPGWYKDNSGWIWHKNWFSFIHDHTDTEYLCMRVRRESNVIIDSFISESKKEE